MTADTDGEPDFKSVEKAIEQAIKSKVAEVRTSIPGYVQSYDKGDQRASVVLANQLKRHDPETDEIESYDVPPIPNCPVQFPQGMDGKFSITWPLQQGDPVQIHFAMRSLDEWLSGGGDGNDPADPRRFDLSDAVVVPGVRSFASALGSDAVDGSAIVIKGPSIKMGDASPADWVARADKVLTNLNLIATPLNTIIQAWNSVASSGGGPLQVPGGSTLNQYTPTKPKSNKVETD